MTTTDPFANIPCTDREFAGTPLETPQERASRTGRQTAAPEAEPWEAPDGTLWLHFPNWGNWQGWMPGEDGLFVMDEYDFRCAYPDAPGIGAGLPDPPEDEIVYFRPF